MSRIIRTKDAGYFYFFSNEYLLWWLESYEKLKKDEDGNYMPILVSITRQDIQIGNVGTVDQIIRRLKGLNIPYSINMCRYYMMQDRARELHKI